MNAIEQAGFPRLPLPEGGTAVASQWTVPTTEGRSDAITAALSAMPPAPGLRQFSVFRGTEDHTVFLLSQWDGTGARDAFLGSNSAPRAEVDQEVPEITRDWREILSQYKSFATENQAEPGALVVVRQPLRMPDPDEQADWVNTVMAALSSEPAPEGLVSATFFVSADAAAVVNLAQWTTAEAHRDVLAKGPGDSQSSLGASAEWMAVRRHPAITSGHSVRRYRFAGAVAPVRS